MYKIDMSLVIRMKKALETPLTNRNLVKELPRGPEVFSHQKLDKFVDFYVTKIKEVRDFFFR